MELDLNEYKPGWHKFEPMERVYIKYDQKKNLPTHKYILPNQRENEFKALESAVCVTNEDNHNLIPS